MFKPNRIRAFGAYGLACLSTCSLWTFIRIRVAVVLVYCDEQTVSRA